MAALAAILLAGCSGGKLDGDGYKKDDFKPTPVPAGYGPPGGKPAAPPANTGG
ncbi:hypothetical protein BH11ARM2_BH11ARM2_07870 [soil metagenome]